MIVVVTYYTGALTALILIPQIEPQLNDFETMVVKQSQYEWSYQEGSVLEQYLMKTPGQLFKDILELAERHPTSYEESESYMYNRIQVIMNVAHKQRFA